MSGKIFRGGDHLEAAIARALLLAADHLRGQDAGGKSCPRRAHAVPMPCPCRAHAMHTCHAHACEMAPQKGSTAPVSTCFSSMRAPGTPLGCKPLALYCCSHGCRTWSGLGLGLGLGRSRCTTDPAAAAPPPASPRRMRTRAAGAAPRRCPMSRHSAPGWASTPCRVRAKVSGRS